MWFVRGLRHAAGQRPGKKIRRYRVTRYPGREDAVGVGVGGRVRFAEVLRVQVEQPLPEGAELVDLGALPGGQVLATSTSGDQGRDLAERVPPGEREQHLMHRLHGG